MKNKEPHNENFDSLEQDLNKFFAEEQTIPHASVKYALDKQLKARRQQQYRNLFTGILMYRMPAYQPVLVLAMVAGLWYGFRNDPKIKFVEKMRPVYVYKTDTVKIPVTEYVYVNNAKKTRPSEQKHTINMNGEYPLESNTLESTTPFPGEAIKLAESQTGRNLHDDSAYVRLFVSLR